MKYSTTDVSVLPVKKDKGLINEVSQLARDIYLTHHSTYLDSKMATKMYNIYQSPEAIEYAINKGEEYYLVQMFKASVGYLAVDVQKEKDRVFLSKFYLDSKCRGRGIGRYLMDSVIQLAKYIGLSTVDLLVYKGNQTFEIYKKFGFKVLKDIYEKLDNGIINDEYLMRLEVQKV